MAEGIPLPKLMEHLTQQAILADAEMQLLQRKGWMDINQGSPLFEGMDHLDYLCIQELSFTFWVEPARLGLWARIKNSYRYLLGKPQPVASLHPLTPCNAERPGFNITVTVSRKNDRFAAEASPNTDDKENIYVTGLSA